MIRALREMPEGQLRTLAARLAKPGYQDGSLKSPEALSALSGDELWSRVAKVIKTDGLNEKESIDLGLALRKRLIEVADERFKILGPGESDTMTDLEIAAAITDFVLDARELIRVDEDLEAEVNTFFRTRPKGEKDLVMNAAIQTRKELQDAGEQRHSADDPAKRTRPRSTSVQVAAGTAAVAALSAAAGPLGLLGGSLFMAGVTAKKGKIARSKDNVEPRGNRARHSRLIQNVIRLSATAVASMGDVEKTRGTVQSHLKKLGYDVELLAGGETAVTEGSVKVVIKVVEDEGRSIVRLRSKLLHGGNPTDDQLAELLKQNAEQTFGRFAWGEADKSVVVDYELLGDTLDLDELGFSLARLAKFADDTDETLLARFGGTAPTYS